MSPETVRAYLDVMRAAGVTRGQLTLGDGAVIQVEFGPLPVAAPVFVADAPDAPNVPEAPDEDLPPLAFDPDERRAKR